MRRSIAPYVYYFHNDNQGSIGLITDDTFNPNTPTNKQDELSDIFGQPRLNTGAIDPNWGTTDVTKRRYINQEDLTDAQLIDLNARVYDPLLAKFMSPDPVIADQDDSQSWNAYAYSHNNPMSREDPTGLNDPPPPPQDKIKSVCGAKCKTEQGNPAAAVSGGGAHFVGAQHIAHNSLLGLAQRAVNGGSNSVAGRALAEAGYSYGAAQAYLGLCAALSVQVSVDGTVTWSDPPKSEFHVYGIPKGSIHLQLGKIAFYAPWFANFRDIQMAGQRDGDSLAAVRSNVGRNGTFDYQRAFGHFFDGWTTASNIGVGYYMQGAGSSRFMMDVKGDGFGLLTGTPMRALAADEPMWNLGYDSAASGAYPVQIK